ncbi:MAG: hypothetical protein ABI616_02545 [Pseudomonadota bacterium]
MRVREVIRVVAARLLVVIGVTLVAVGGAQAQAPANRAADPCQRSCLEGFVNTYLGALTSHDPKRLPLAANVRFTENGAKLALGEGLWKTASSAMDYRIYIADPQSGQVGFIGTILQQDGKQMMLALRLKLSNGAISEIETVTGTPFQLPGSPLVAAPRPALAQAVPANQRLSRQQMIALANRNFDGVVAADGNHFAADCQRVENRMAMSGNPKLDYPIATLPDRAKPQFAAMGCKEQVEAHLFDTLDSVDSRRFLVIDEERQLVFGVLMLNWYRDTQCNEVKGYGRVCRPAGQKPTGLRVAEMLRVAGGRVHEVEVVFNFAAYQAPSGWESTTCDRGCLTGVIDQYLAALVARDPAKLALAGNVKYTENGTPLRVGEGLWQTATGLGDYKMYVADPVAGQIGFVGEVREGSEATMIGLRLKVEQGKIGEIEAVIGRSFRSKHPSMVTQPRAAFSQVVPPGQRLSREQMIATVNANFDGILANNGDIYAPDCQRIENRMPMSGNPQLNYPIVLLPDRPDPHFGSMDCKAQIEAHLFDTLDRVDRRILVLDEERQLVFGVYMLRFYGRTACNDIPGYGRTCPKAEQKPISLRSAEVLGVRGGQIHEVEVVFTRAQYDATAGW